MCFELARGSPAQRLSAVRRGCRSAGRRLQRRETGLDLVGRAERLPQRSADAQPVRPREHPVLCDRYLFSRNSRSPDWRAQLDTGWAAVPPCQFVVDKRRKIFNHASAPRAQARVAVLLTPPSAARTPTPPTTLAFRLPQASARPCLRSLIKVTHTAQVTAKVYGTA